MAMEREYGLMVGLLNVVAVQEAAAGVGG